MTTFMNGHDVRRRMQCGGAMANRIESKFITVEQLLEAIEGDGPLTDINGIGPKTAETIEEWYDNRFEREEKVDNAEVNRTGAKTATVYNLGDWSDAIESDD